MTLLAYRGQYVITKRQSRFYILSILASVCLSLLAALSYFSGVSSILGSAVNLILSPINGAVSEVVESIVDVKNYFGDIAQLKEENLRLMTENEALKKEKAESEAVKKENRELYSYLGLKEDFTDLTLVNAKLTSRSLGGFMTSFTIDKGTIHGVKKDMPIITSSGILGIVSEEGLATSRCKSLVSHNSSAGVYILRTGVPCILEGDYALSSEGLCKLSGLGQDTDIVPGDYVYTSGFGEIFPKDLCVGTVKDVIKDASTHTVTATVIPACSPDSIDTVMVITDFERKYESVVLPRED